MRVDVADAIWSQPAHFSNLQRLMRRASQGQHVVIVSDLDEVAGSLYFAQAVAPLDDEDYRRTLGAGRYASTSGPAAHVRSNIQLSARTSNGFDLAPADLGPWSERPLEVLLENETDWLLVRMARRAIGPGADADKLDDAIVLGWLVPTGCGGCDGIKRQVQRSDIERRLAVVDSDRDTVGANHKHPDIADACSIENTPMHILAGHELENYLPRHVAGRVIRRTRGRSRAPQRQRENRVWTAVLRELDGREASLVQRHGRPAWRRVRQEVYDKASRQMSRRALQASFDAHCALEAPARAVDDLKARLSPRTCAAWVKEVEETFDSPGTLSVDPDIRRDLQTLAHLILEWL